MSGFMALAEKCGLNPATDETVSDSAYPFIPHYSPVVLAQTFIRVEKYLYNKGIKHDPTFLDAGCGIGNIMLLARSAGFDVSGIDLNPDLIELAHYLLDSHVVHENSFTLDIANILSYNKYNTFDVIYYYHPLSDSKLESEFEKKVEDEAKEGAIIIAALKRDWTIIRDKRFRRLKYLESTSDASVFQKICATV